DTLGRGGRPVDTAAARRLGLPTGPTRSFPAPDAVMDSLLKLTGYRVIRYVAETLVVRGDSQTIFLRGETFVDRDGTKLEADSIRYHEAACELNAFGGPRLFDQGTVLVGDRMRYDTCRRRGVVVEALTDFQQGSATWWMRGDLAVDSASTRLYGASSTVTTCELPVAHYHFAAREVKWINKHIMVARPAVLYVRDVPILWLPFIFQDIRSGRRSGMLVPQFGLSDLVRPSRSYRRHVDNVGYYFAINDYTDLLVRAGWYSGRAFSVTASSNYRWLDRFINGGLTYSRTEQLDARATSNSITWRHNQSFDSRTQLNANVNYMTNARVIPRNTVDPNAATAQISSSLTFNKSFSWGTLSIGGSRRQNFQDEQVSQDFPTITLTPAPIDLTPWMTWSPGFRLQTSQTFKNGPTLIPIPGDTAVDTLRHLFDTRNTNLSFQTPLRLGRWNWANSFTVTDGRSTQRQEFLIPDSTAPGGVRRVLYGETFETAINWQTGINLPQLLSGSWKLSPGVSIVNTTGGPFMIRNQFTGGEFVQQGKRLQFSLSARPTLFAFFSGFGPLQRIRHSVSPSLSYNYAPAARVPEAFARAIAPTDTSRNALVDPQQTITFGLSQNFEAKVRPPPGDSAAEPRKIRLLSINTSSIGYNFEQAKLPGRTGWTTQSLTNRFASDLLPGFDLTITHDLWRGRVGIDTSRFDPFLQTVQASFAVTPGTLRGLAGLLGIAGKGGAGPAAPAVDTIPAGQQGLPGTGTGGPYAGGGTSPYAGPGGGGFSMAVSYSSTRSRTAPSGAAGGRQVLNLNMSFTPTPNWRATWSTSYDVDTRRFGQHAVQFQRDLHRWQASFGYLLSATGSFAFTFAVSLRDQPEIKFDYDQQTLAR
ncbi:MAG: putative LPS assembly protein LptD, partial [Gemmatimonadales bacterium]